MSTKNSNPRDLGESAPADPFAEFYDLPIAFDADGVILNFLGSFAMAAKRALGREVSSVDPTSYSLAKRFDLSGDELNKVWEEFNSGPYWRELAALEGAIEAIAKLQEVGFRNIHVVTAIADQFRPHRHENFRALGFSPEAIHCVEHINRWSKVPPIVALKPFMFVDDRIEHLHSNVQVPLLIHIDHGDEQFPCPEGRGRVDATVKSLAQWVDNFLSQPEHWASIIRENLKNHNLPEPSASPAAKRPARRRSSPT